MAMARKVITAGTISGVLDRRSKSKRRRKSGIIRSIRSGVLKTSTEKRPHGLFSGSRGRKAFTTAKISVGRQGGKVVSRGDSNKMAIRSIKGSAVKRAET